MADIKLFRSERLTDNPDGGGLATSTVVVDGEVNNVFDDISRIDRVNGDLSLRKVFALADGANVDLYSGLHAIVAAPPLDPRVSAVIFRTRRTGSTQYAWGDERADAQAAVERYLDESVITRMVPYDRQLEGQRTVLVFQRPELPLPEIGMVYALKDEVVDATEFVRVEDIDHQVETFTDIHGDYRARVITLTITQPLSREFGGSQPNRYFTAEADKAVLRKTVASDAARYKGVVKLSEDAAVGDLTVKVESIFAQLVPAATSEVGITDARPAGAETLLHAANVDREYLAGNMSQLQVGVFFETAVGFPLDLGWGSASTPRQYREQVDGSFLNIGGGAETGTTAVGPGRRSVTFTGHATGDRGVKAFYRPSVVVGRAGFSWQQPVEMANRGYVYVGTLHPPPQPGTLTVHYRALGTWYELSDDGSGALVGDAGTGSGLVNFGSGSFNVSLGALPDIGSAVIATWAGSSEFEIRAGSVEILPPAVRLTLGAENCEPGTLELAWEAGGVERTATDDGIGNLSGDAAGRVVYATGEVELRPALLPDAASTLSAEYEAADTAEETFTPSKTGSDLVLELGELPRAGSLQVQYNAFAENYAGDHVQVTRVITDDGEGGLVDQRGAILGGSISYVTGALVIPADFVANAATAVRSAFGQPLPTRTAMVDQRPGIFSVELPWRVGIERGEVAANFVNGTAVSIRYKLASASDLPQEEEFDLPPLVVDLTPRVRSGAVPGSLMFTLGTRTYYERSGTLYYGMNPANGAGTAAGTIDYASGLAAITSWEGGIAPAFVVQALLTELAPVPQAVVHGRTPGSPLRPGTFYIQANRPDGTLVSGTSDNNGLVTGSGVHGTVDSTTGVFGIGFGAYVLDSSLSSEDKAEPWYDPANIDGEGYIWRPAEVLPDTIRFNCVVQVAATLDPEIIGVNPVRLPMDGRVPVIRRGDTLVVQDTQPYEMPDDLEAEQVVALPRGNLASVWLYDQDGLGVPEAFYSVDKVAGGITMADTLDLSEFAEPLVAIHTVEDMGLCLDALVSGQVSLGQALTHDYNADNATLSSAQVIGDVQARYQGLFAQNTWTGEWSDTLIGNAPTGGGQYNDATFPLQVLNRDTITQRWRLQFTSSTAFSVIGEELGVIDTGTTSTGAAPINPATSEPYFEILGAGFGSGWATGNAIRFNTVAAGGPIWIARTVRSGPATALDDRIRLETRWDKD